MMRGRHSRAVRSDVRGRHRHTISSAARGAARSSSPPWRQARHGRCPRDGANRQQVAGGQLHKAERPSFQASAPACPCRAGPARSRNQVGGHGWPGGWCPASARSNLLGPVGDQLVHHRRIGKGSMCRQGCRNSSRDLAAVMAAQDLGRRVLAGPAPLIPSAWRRPIAVRTSRPVALFSSHARVSRRTMSVTQQKNAHGP